MEEKRYTLAIGDKTLQLEKTELASQANAAVMARLGETVVLATAVMAKKPREGGTFFPLTVDYEEKFSAAGKILGSRFLRREGRASEEAILSGRLIDRSLRPLFPPKMRNDVQIIITVLSIDGENDPDIPALVAASTALNISDIPWHGPIGAVRVGKKEAGFILNPTHTERNAGTLDLVFTGTKEHINMIEAGAKELPEGDMREAFHFGKQTIEELAELQETMRKDIGKEKYLLPQEESHEELLLILRKEISPKLEVVLGRARGKKEFYGSLGQLKDVWFGLAKEKNAGEKIADFLFEEEINEIVHRNILERDIRPDGRKLDEVRHLASFVGVLPRVHGSGLFIRGDTKVLSTLTLGAPGDELMIQGMEVRGTKRFMHHYNFPPYSVGEIAPLRGPGRREIGHGALAERSLAPVIPPKETFPYTIRIVSEALSSNGSTSMASACASTLALMDAGVPITKPVAGIAMGLMSDENGRWKVLTDIQGPEDHHGDMDFKIAGTRDGITAVQMDVKIRGLTFEIIDAVLQGALKARLHILDAMAATLPRPRAELSPWAPRIITFTIPTDKIRDVIGPGGKVINEIIAATGATIDIEDDGRIFITGETPGAAEQALERIKQLTKEIKVGEIFEGKVTRLFPFGAMMELGPRQEGLIHISELATERVDRVEDVIKVGDHVSAKVVSIDDQGRVNLSRRELLGGAPRQMRDDSRPHHRRPPLRGRR